MHRSILLSIASLDILGDGDVDLSGSLVLRQATTELQWLISTRYNRRAIADELNNAVVVSQNSTPRSHNTSVEQLSTAAHAACSTTCTRCTAFLLVYTSWTGRTAQNLTTPASCTMLKPRTAVLKTAGVIIAIFIFAWIAGSTIGLQQRRAPKPSPWSTCRCAPPSALLALPTPQTHPQGFCARQVGRQRRTNPMLSRAGTEHGAEPPSYPALLRP